jgi:4-amino-4-deoxy-L-arabinose transferase-like glycosyltransferase
MSRSRYLTILLISAVAIRLIAMPIGLKHVKSRGLSAYDEYGFIAQNIIEGRGFSYDWFGSLHATSIHAPAYPFILAGLFSLFGQGIGGALAAILLSIVASGVFLYIVFRTAESLFGPLAGFAALAILAFYPVQIYYSANVLPTIMYEGIFFLAILLAWRLRHDPSPGRGLMWGLSLGLAALSYSFVLALAPLLALWIVIAVRPSHRRQALLSVMLAAFVAMLICAPWTMRNYRVHHRWIPIRDQMGTNLWGGNGPLASGSGQEGRGKNLNQFPEDIARALQSIPNEVDQDRYLRTRAIQYMREHPRRTARIWLAKIGTFWWFREGQLGEVSGIQRMMPLLKISKALLLFFSAWGAVLIWRRNRSLAIIGFGACAALTLVFMITLSDRIRYFTPLEPILAIAAGYAIAWAIERLLPMKVARLQRN